MAGSGSRSSVTRLTSTVLVGLQLCLFGSIGAGCGSDKPRDQRATGGSSGSGGASQGPPTGNAGSGGLTGNAGTSAGGTNGGGATGGTMGQPPPGSARVRFVLKEVH